MDLAALLINFYVCSLLQHIQVLKAGNQYRAGEKA